MTNTIPSGLGATLGIVQEGTVGTAQTVTRWIPFDRESLSLKKITAQSTGLHQGLYQQTNRRAYVAHTVDGTIDLDVTDRQMGLLLKNMIGGTGTAASVGGGAYLSTQAPGDTAGMSMTVQKGVPETITGPGTIQAFTYNGCKVKDWTLSVQRSGLGKLSLTLDAWNESTVVAYAAPSFVAGNVMSFLQGSVKLGGTASTTGGITTITAGAAPTGVISQITIKGTNALDDARFTIGSDTKKEQYSNGFRAVTGTMDIEFSNLTDYYNTFSSTAGLETATALEFDFLGASIGGGNSAFLKTVLPYIYYDAAPVVIEGPQTIIVKTAFTALDNMVDNVIQFQYQSLDSAI